MASIKNNVSNIAVALATNTTSGHVFKQRSASGTGHGGNDKLVPMASEPGNHCTSGLFTPPSSVSPNLPAGSLRAKHIHDSLGLPPPAEVDSDIDLQDGLDHAQSQEQPLPGLAVPSGTLPGFDAAGLISPALLAKHHLPGILLQHGPIAIRHVMSYLMQSVPGFSQIPPPKARRLVVGALESRAGGGIHGDVEFEKVGWGRWDARVKGQPSREHRVELGNLSPPTSVPSSYSPSSGGLTIPSIHQRREGWRDLRSGASWTASSIEENQDKEVDKNMTMAEHEADKMSLDERDDSAVSCSSSSAPEETNAILDAEMGEDTDEEDWASIGAAALRQASFDARSGGGFLNDTSRNRRIDYNYLSASLAKRAPQRPMMERPSHTLQRYLSSKTEHVFSMIGPAEDETQREREAVEALLKMGGSM